MESSYVGSNTLLLGKNKYGKVKPGAGKNGSTSALGLSPMSRDPIL